MDYFGRLETRVGDEEEFIINLFFWISDDHDIYRVIWADFIPDSLELE